MITYYVACSLDNLIAGPNGELDWLPQPVEGGDDFGYGAFYAPQDVVVMGRKTYEICLGFGPEAWPYGGKETWVLTRQAPPASRFGEKFAAFDPEFWRRLGQEKKVYLNGGGEVARLFLRQGLIDRLELAVFPVTLGTGLPLFAQGFPRTHWKLESSKAHPSGALLNVYTRGPGGV